MRDGLFNPYIDTTDNRLVEYDIDRWDLNKWISDRMNGRDK